MRQYPPVALFMAGIPGAGKTEFITRFLYRRPKDMFIKIDLDTIVALIPGYTPEKYYNFRGPANIILEAALDNVIENKLNFALDGTFSHPKAISNINRSLKHGFFVVLFYIYQDPFIAWSITKDRELETKRGIDKNGFINSCLKTPENIKSVLRQYQNKSQFYPVGILKDSLNQYSFTTDTKSHKKSCKRINERSAQSCKTRRKNTKTTLSLSQFSPYTL